MEENGKSPGCLVYAFVTIGIIGTIFFFIYNLATAGAEFWGGLIFLVLLVIIAVLYENGKK